MFTESEGNLLNAPVEALVNTVNTVGVMGKGIALQFKRAYPAMFRDYVAATKRGEIELGKMHVWHASALGGPDFIINFPTKSHWRSASTLADIGAGLDDLARVIEREGIRSVALPPLGCGLGGLDWSDVEPLIRDKLGDLERVEIHLYPPAGSPPAAEMRTAEPKPRMTPGRAALVVLVDSYSRVAVEGATAVAIQKLMYFLQEAGEPLRLRFSKNLYGPYADGLRAVMRSIEGHYLEGFGDGSQRVQVAEPFRVMPGAVDEARLLLSERPETVSRIARVMDLAAGFESAASLELLATTDWVARHSGTADPSEDDVAARVRSWSTRKERLFTDGQVHKAYSVLRDKGWL